MTKSEIDLSAVEHDDGTEVEAPYGASYTISEPTDLSSSSADLQSERERAIKRRRGLYESQAKQLSPLAKESELEIGSTTELIDLAPAHMVRETASSDLQSEENWANERRLRLYESLTPEFLALIQETELEYGFTSALDSFLRDRLAENATATRDWLSRVFIEHIADIAVASGILRTIAHLSYNQIYPEGTLMALTALNHTDVQVREAGIRAFEHWSSPESLDALKNMKKCPERWLAEYVAKVIRDLEEELIVDVGSRKEDR